MPTTWIVATVIGGVVVGAMLGWLLRGRVCRKAHAGLVNRYEPAGLRTFFPSPEPPGEAAPMSVPEAKVDGREAQVDGREAQVDGREAQVDGREAQVDGVAALPGGAAPGPSYVVKAKKVSRIYHTTASPSYARTVADVWFESAHDAEAAGFRPPRARAKRTPTA